MSPEEVAMITGLTTSLYEDQRFHDISYSNIQISGPGVNDTYDRNILIEPAHIASLWPGTVKAMGEYRKYFSGILDGYESDDPVIQHAEATKHQKLMRDLILGGYIGEAALNRYDQNVPEEITDFLNKAGPLATTISTQMCVSHEAPSSVAIVSTVVLSEVITPGEKVAHLYYPSSVHPKRSLTQLRGALKRMIKEDEVS